MGLIAYLLFLLAGVGFGYAAPGRWKWVALLFPLLLGLGAVFNHGVDAWTLVRLLIALIVTAVGILVGTVIDARASARGEHPRYA